jgi:hypothetical protein
MYVAITSRLEADVSRLINTMKGKELSSVQGYEDVYAATDEGQIISRAIWGEHLHFMNELPEKWMGSEGRLRISFDKHGDVTALISLDLPVRTPPGFYHPGPLRISPSMGEAWPAWAVDILKTEEERLGVEKRWENVNDQIMGFLQGCKSLNEALKLWPQVEMYIPKVYLDRVAAKPDRSNKTDPTEALRGLDTEMLTASAVIARISNN